MYYKQVMTLFSRDILGGLKLQQDTDTILLVSYVRKYVRSCHVCQKMPEDETARCAPVQEFDFSSSPLQKLAIDPAGPIYPASARGHKFIISIIDLCCCQCEALPLYQHGTYSRALISVFCRMDFPDVIFSNNGTQFISRTNAFVYWHVVYSTDVQLAVSSKTNEVIEKFYSCLKQMLSKV